MAKKKKALPKNFAELIRAKDIPALKAVFDSCELDARGGLGKVTALSFFQVPDELARWLAEQGADVNAQDRYQRTPLHHQAGTWCGNIELFLELGADIEALDYQNETPLHSAAGRFQAHAVRTLLAHGANVRAEDNWHETPLMSALSGCQNIDISNASEVARLLAEAGSEISEKMREQVRSIGKNFEFHRADFNKDYLAETEAGLARLYELFSVAPVPERQIHDGVSSPITVPDAEWDEQHDALWALLVPGRGNAKTVQGEVIRLSGRLAHEIMDNGGANWDADFRKMLDALVKHFGTGTPLAADELEEAAGIAQILRGGDGDEEPERLMELAVHWVKANPQPVIGDSKPNYRR
ncbi:MAG: ankyrin repeat domain-containing protein [Clostridiales Family XIII bacterium]|jgi:hypothetical protein|nr:ankyrin repeat domain-containing protein [Clostridiales Family XIII bacterium]